MYISVGRAIMVSGTPSSSGQTHHDLKVSSKSKAEFHRCSSADKAFASCMCALFRPNNFTCKRPSQVVSYEAAKLLALIKPGASRHAD